jgi:hypothetical protein
VRLRLRAECQSIPEQIHKEAVVIAIRNWSILLLACSGLGVFGAAMQAAEPPAPLGADLADLLLMADPGQLEDGPDAEPSPQTDDNEDCLTSSQLRGVVPGIEAVSLDVLRGPGRTPGSCFAEQPFDETPSSGNLPRWAGCNGYHWKASGLFSNPLYFEDVSLERYGRTSCVQNVVSGAKFFGTVAILPYKMGVDCPREHVYVLGHKRPGNCAPAVCEHPPCSLRGAALQAGAVTGIGFLFP